MIRDAIILGAGAAGLMCAMTAGRRGFSCAVIDHSPVAGRKVRLAGGGKGNVTNRYISPEWYVGTQKGFPDTLLKRCSTDFVLSMLASFGIEWEEREYGQIFCTVQAARLVESMAAACRNAGAELLFNRTFGEIRHEGGLFSVETSGGTLQAPRLVIATGSPAWPTCGATDGGMRLARQWGHKVVPVRPVLAPLLLPESWPLHGLAGVSRGRAHFPLPAPVHPQRAQRPRHPSSILLLATGRSAAYRLSARPSLLGAYAPTRARQEYGLGAVQKGAPHPPGRTAHTGIAGFKKSRSACQKRQGIPCASNT